MGAIDIPAATKEVEVDQNLPIKMYLRSARHLLHAADVYRNEGNILQVYIFMLRYISLVLKTIPKHRDANNISYRLERSYLKQRAMEAFTELEKIKPEAERQNRLLAEEDFAFPEEDEGVVPSYFPTSPQRSAVVAQVGMGDYFGTLYGTPGSSANGGGSLDLDAWARSINAPPSQQQQSYGAIVSTNAPPVYSVSASVPSYSLPIMSSLSLSSSSSLPQPSAEALSRHSFFSFSGPMAPHPTDSMSSGPLQVSYPSLDSTPVAIPDLLTSWQQGPAKQAAAPAPAAAPTDSTSTSAEAAPASNDSALPASTAATAAPSTAQPQPRAQAQQPPQEGANKDMISVLIPAVPATDPRLAKPGDPGAAAAPAAAAAAAATAAVDVAPVVAPRVQPVPPPVRVEVQAMPRENASSNGLHVQPHPSAVADPRPGKAVTKVGAGTITKPGGIKSVHISPHMMEEFMRLVNSNTRRNLETCGILAGVLKKDKYFITTLILPKQQATSDSCSTLNEEEIFEVQDKRGLFQIGWIHTHPSQACFMSSIDLHTHYSYQVMLPEAIAIVMAPSDTSRRSGIFRLSDPGGMKVVAGCRQRGFHPHESPPDGGPIYVHSSHVYYNPKVKFDVEDIRATKS